MPQGDLSGERKTVTWLKENFSGIIAIVGAAIIAFTGLSIAQNDIEHLEKNDEAQDKILAEIPAMAADIENIEGDVGDINDAVQRIETLLTDSVIEDAKYHHEH